jgi:hypothetical protein
MLACVDEGRVAGVNVPVDEGYTALRNEVSNRDRIDVIESAKCFPFDYIMQLERQVSSKAAKQASPRSDPSHAEKR